MHVVITGAAGFLGSHLCEKLLQAGNNVTGLDNLITGKPENIDLLSQYPNFTFIHTDVIEKIPDLPAVQRVYHLASPASPIDYVKLPFETMYVGSDGTRNALQLAHKHDARFLLASTSEVYGDPHIHPQPEEYWGNVNPIGPRSVYDEAKRYAEALSMAFYRYHQLKVRIIRIFNTYGPRMRHNDGRVIPTFICQALNKQPLTVFGDGQQTRSFCFVDDLIDGMHRLMESSLTTPCNIGNPYELSMLELATAINNATNNPAGIIFKPLPKDDPSRRKPVIDLAQKHLDWSPNISFQSGIQKTIAWFASSPATKQSQ